MRPRASQDPGPAVSGADGAAARSARYRHDRVGKLGAAVRRYHHDPEVELAAVGERAVLQHLDGGALRLQRVEPWHLAWGWGLGIVGWGTAPNQEPPNPRPQPPTPQHHGFLRSQYSNHSKFCSCIALTSAAEFGTSPTPGTTPLLPR